MSNTPNTPNTPNSNQASPPQQSQPQPGQSVPQPLTPQQQPQSVTPQTMQQQQPQQPTSAPLPTVSPALNAQPTPSAIQYSPADIDKMVASYLQKKGYKATEVIFTREARGEKVPLEKIIGETAGADKGEKSKEADTSAANTPTSNSKKGKDKQKAKDSDVIMDEATMGAETVEDPETEAVEEEEEDPDLYELNYKNLREWIENSLDWYKPELRSVLFPIFVHSYLDLVSKSQLGKAKQFMDKFKRDHVELHTPDLNILETVAEPHHVQENELAQMYKHNKYNLRMSGVPFELFLNYLQDNKFMLLLRIVNQYLNIQVVHGKLLKSAGGLELDGVIGITGHQTQQLEEFNRQPVQLGLNQFDQNFKEEIESTLKDYDKAKKEEYSKNENNLDQMEPLSLLDTFKKYVQEYTADGPAPDEIPLPPYRGTDITAQVEYLKSMSHRLPLNQSSLPSICCYTFHNTHDSLNCITTSKDATLIAGGFSESYIKIWSLKGEKLRSLRNTINPAHVNDYNDLNRQKERQGSDYKKLVGHSGPIYGLSFSPNNKYLVSASEDKTVRLWSTQTFTNLVVYKGHNSPVWDVDFGPYGFYFATGAHDRTARLWCVDHINPLRIFAGHLSDVDTVKFHPNSKYLVTGSSDRTSRLWDVQSGNCVRVFTGHTGAIKTVAVSPNGRLMASAGEDKSIMLWDLGSGKRIKKLTGHTGFIYSLTFSADSSVLVSGGSDNAVCVWDVNTASTSATYMDTTAAVTTASQDSINGLNNESKRLKLDDSETSGRKHKRVHESQERLAVFPTKLTPLYDIRFTDRNACIVAGAYTPQKSNEH